MILYKNILVENAWEQRMFTTMQKKGQLILKTPMALFKVQMHKKVFFMKSL